MASSYTRRNFVVRGATLAGAASAVTVVGVGGVERALAAAAGPALSAKRQATYAAIVEAVALSGKLDVHAKNLQRSTDAFADVYANSTDEMRANTDVVLDLVERGPGGDGFAQMDRRARLKQLRRWLAADTTDPTKPTPATAAPVAVVLAALPFYPHHGPHEPIEIAL